MLNKMDNNKKKKIIWTMGITYFISTITIIISLLISHLDKKEKPIDKNVEFTALAKEKRELAILDSLLSQREYYQKQLTNESTGIDGSIYGYGARAKYLEKIIAEINKEIEKIVPSVATKETIVANAIPKTEKDMIKDNNLLESEMLETIEQYNGMTKTKEVLEFYYTRLNNYYKINGLSKETNALLRSSITEINKELDRLINEEFNELNKSTPAKTEDSLNNVTKEKTDTLLLKKQMENDTINLQ